MEVLHLVVDCNTSHDIWTTLETTLASPSNSRIMQLHGSFQELRQNDEFVSTYLHKAKSLFDDLAAAGRSISVEEFNLYVLLLPNFWSTFLIKFLKNPKIAKNNENPKKYVFNIFASFLAFSTSSKKNLSFQRFFERVRLSTRHF